MTLTLEQLPGEPILIATFTGPVTAEDAHAMFQHTADLRDQLGGRVYRLTDLTRATSDFEEMLNIIHEASTGYPGTTSDPHVVAAFVGRTETTETLQTMMQRSRFGYLEVPIFDTLEEGIAYMRERAQLQTQ